MIHIDMRTGRGLNSAETWRKRSKRVKAEKHLVGWSLLTLKRFEIPCVVLITRIAPSNGLDDDNLSGACKAIRDSVATWLKVDDGHPSVQYRYAQRRGPWGIEITSTTRGEELIRLQALLGSGVKA